MGKDKAPAAGKGKPADVKPAEAAKDAGKAAPAGGKTKGKKQSHERKETILKISATNETD